MKREAETFIRSWSTEDTYSRFGSTGIGGPELLVEQLRQRERFALIACGANEVIALLDYISRDGLTYFGMVVDERFRRMRIGTSLVRALLMSHAPRGAVQVECGNRNGAAIALLRGCGFTPVASDRYDTTWRYELRASRLLRPYPAIALSNP